MRKAKILLVVAASYLGASSILHYVLFPEPYPDQSDLPRRGTTIVNENIHSRFVFLQTAIETDGQLIEIDNFVEPGGGPIEFPHVHPRMREIFSVVDGELTFAVNGVESVVSSGSAIVVEPGSSHAFLNSSNRPAHMVARLEVAEEGEWLDQAARGLLPDSGFVQMDRAGGIGGVSPAQMIVFANRYRDVYPPKVPRWLVDAVGFLVAPTARLFGLRSYYEPTVGADRIE